jgi:hypothetical protein
VEVYIEEARLIEPGTRKICRAIINSRHQSVLKGKYVTSRVEAKLDSCGSVSIGHSTLLSDIRTCKEYRVPTVTLKGIGGTTEPLTRAGILKHVLPNGRMVKWLCYVFDTPVGRSEKLLLLSMSAIKLSGIDVNYHIDQSFEGRCAPLRFRDKFKSTGETHSRAETYYYKIDKGDLTSCDLYRNTTLYDAHDNIVLMTEIQLKNIVDRLGKESVTGTDGSEFTIKYGIKINKFSKEAMEIGPDVNVRLQQKVYDQFTGGRLSIHHQKWEPKDLDQVH